MKAFIKRSPFVQNLLILISGTAAGQLISIVSLPLLQRLYPPGDFAILQLLVSFSSILAAVATLKFEYAIMIAEEDESKRLTVISFISVFLFTLIIVPFLIFKATVVFPDVKQSELHLLIFLIPLTAISMSLTEVLSFVLNRNGQYKKMAVAKISQNVSMEAFRFLNILTLKFPGGLLIGRFVGFLFSFVYAIRFVDFRPKMRSIKMLWITATKYRQFALFTMPTVLISAFTNYYFYYHYVEEFGTSITGVIGVANQYITLPLGLIAGSFSQVFYKKITSTLDKESLLKLYKKFALQLSLVGIALAAVVIAIPSWIFPFILGDEWQHLGYFVKLTVLWQTIAFVSSSLSFIYSRLQKQNIMMWFALLQLAMVYISLTIGSANSLTSNQTFIYYVSFQSIYYLLTILLAIRLIKKM